jgi:hypothetical protein
MGPPENPTAPSRNQGRTGRRRRSVRRPRTRRCLLKGCERRFRPKQARERYCSPECRRAARDWSCWKARLTYRATASGKAKRQGQSRRYRERVKDRQQTAPAQTSEPARVITHNFFRGCLRPPRMLSGIHVSAPLAAPKILLPRLPEGHRASLAARTPLAPDSATPTTDLSRPARQIIPTY